MELVCTFLPIVAISSPLPGQAPAQGVSGQRVTSIILSICFFLVLEVPILSHMSKKGCLCKGRGTIFCLKPTNLMVLY